MKKFLSVLLMAAGLMSCGDDDKYGAQNEAYKTIY